MLLLFCLSLQLLVKLLNLAREKELLLRMTQYLFVFLLHHSFELNIPCSQLAHLLFEKFPFLRLFYVYFGDFLVELVLKR